MKLQIKAGVLAFLKGFFIGSARWVAWMSFCQLIAHTVLLVTKHERILYTAVFAAITIIYVNWCALHKTFAPSETTRKLLTKHYDRKEIENSKYECPFCECIMQSERNPLFFICSKDCKENTKLLFSPVYRSKKYSFILSNESKNNTCMVCYCEIPCMPIKSGYYLFIKDKQGNKKMDSQFIEYFPETINIIKNVDKYLMLL